MMGMMSLLGLLSLAQAETFDNLANSMSPGMNRVWQIHGYQRIRSSGYSNLDLDHGLTPSGTPLFPVPITEGQWLSASDIRLRTDISGMSERGSVAVNVRLDFLDNVRLGSIPDGTAIDTRSQLAPEDSVIVRQAYATALTPVGFVIAGRMGTTWGLGMLANSGDCVDCNTADVSDRVGFITSLGGHLWVLSYDFSSTGVGIDRMYNVPQIDAEPSDDAHSLTFAVMDVLSDFTRDRRQKGGRTSVEYGAYYSTRRQFNDVLSPSASNLSANSLMYRGYSATATDGFLRVTHPQFQVGMEAAYLTANIDNPSILPGVSTSQSLNSQQWGIALESQFGSRDAKLKGGVNVALASGDEAPGFGSRVSTNSSIAQAGDLDGVQFDFQTDTSANNFRFHPDYHVDRILWREIIGTVTDAVVIRPHLEWQIAKAGPGILWLNQSVAISQAMMPTSTPSGLSPLGIEWDPSLEYISTDGMGFQIDYALLLPMAGLDNALMGMDAKPAHLIRSHLRYRF